MYQFSGKIKISSIALIIIGALGVSYSFYDGFSKTHQDAEHVISAQQNDGHGGHGKTADAHKEDHDKKNHEVATPHHDNDEHEAHVAHVLHQLHNRPWAAFYVALIFFLGITLLVLAFYASQRVAQSGWSVVLFRVMEAITANIVPTSLIMVIMLIAAVMHWNHLFVWMGEGVFDKGSPNFDPIVYGKKLWLNTPGWVIRGIFYLAGWNLYRWFIRRNSIKEDTATDIKTYKRNYNVSVVFLVFFMITESMMTWDWIMGLDPHWFSTLFGWYVLATLLVSALTVIAFVTIYLRSKGYLPKVNDSHIHDLAKFMFGFSVFWTYLWFAQFMLIWYANIPEEGTYFALRFAEYKLPFLAMLVMNFVFPILLLINSDYKSKPWFVFIGGIVILIGHYTDVFIMIMPATVGGQWYIGVPEISSIVFFSGIFLFATFNAFAKVNPVAKGNPFLKESEQFHYYNIEHEGEENHH
ncbi:MAG: quinol:cytochrome C oxidoreductase [Flavobacteriaceae bacterium]|nr:MAG: quinol:cytochrome C oxidoreductase [Flavobacteriaceae bacterium]